MAVHHQLWLDEGPIIDRALLVKLIIPRSKVELDQVIFGRSLLVHSQLGRRSLLNFANKSLLTSILHATTFLISVEE